MAREAKHALIFLGVLLLVFVGLLWKHWHSPGAALHLFADNTPKPTDSSSNVRTPMPVPPTVVTPRSDSIRPPELAAIADAPLPADRYASGRTDSHPIDDHSPASTWSPSTSRSETASVDPPKSATTTPPNLLTTPAPISAVDDRYAARAEPESTNRSKLDRTETDQSAAPPITPAPTVTTPIASTETSSTAKPYSSAYPSTADDKSNTPPPVTATPIEIPAKSLAQVAQDTRPPTDNRYRDNAFAQNNSASSRYDSGLQRIDSAPPQYATQPAADFAATQPSSGYPPNSPRSSSQFLPSATPAPNSYNANTQFSSGRYGAPPPTSPANPWNAGSNAPPASQQYSNIDQRMGNDTSGGAANIYGNVSAIASPPVQRDGDQYTVAPNDSFWAISQKTYGTGAYFKALYEHNRKRMKDPNDLKVGQTLSVPDEATLRRLYPDLCPKPRKPEASPQQRMITAGARSGTTGRMYTVADGDTLFEIARHELGKPSRWAEIYQLNRDILGEDFDYLRPGTQLIMPADTAPADNPANHFDARGGNTATRQPDAFYPR